MDRATTRRSWHPCQLLAESLKTLSFQFLVVSFMPDLFVYSATKTRLNGCILLLLPIRRRRDARNLAIPWVFWQQKGPICKIDSSLLLPIASITGEDRRVKPRQGSTRLAQKSGRPIRLVKSLPKPCSLCAQSARASGAFGIHPVSEESQSNPKISWLWITTRGKSLW